MQVWCIYFRRIFLSYYVTSELQMDIVHAWCYLPWKFTEYKEFLYVILRENSRQIGSLNSLSYVKIWHHITSLFS